MGDDDLSGSEFKGFRTVGHSPRVQRVGRCRMILVQMSAKAESRGSVEIPRTTGLGAPSSFDAASRVRAARMASRIRRSIDALQGPPDGNPN
jgi:hypothetical protein